MNVSDTGTQETRNEGIGLIVGNNPSASLKDGATVTLNMGAAHANQAYRALLLTTKDGIQTYNSDENSPVVYTDSNGNLTFSNQEINNQANTSIQGALNPQVSGYLSAWIPVGASSTQDARTFTDDQHYDDGKALHDSAALDSNLIYEGFSSFQPFATDHDQYANVLIAKNAPLFKQWGITSFDFPPQYRSVNDNSFVDASTQNGYAFSDRYDLGFDTPTKYGTVDDLRNALQTLHQNGIQSIADMVYNQLYGLNEGNEVVSSTRSDVYGQSSPVAFGTQLYVTNTIGGGDYQKKYGGNFLSLLYSEHPDLFGNSEYQMYASDGNGGLFKADKSLDSLPKDDLIKQWSAKYLNGTNILGRGMGYVLKDWNTGNYFKINGNSTTLPASLSADSIYRHGWSENGDGTWSYYDKDSGSRLNGLQDINGQRLYFDSDGIQVKGKVANINGNMMYFDPNSGELLVNNNVTVDGISYSADSNGFLSTNNSDSKNSDASSSEAASASASTAESLAASSKAASEAASTAESLAASSKAASEAASASASTAESLAASSKAASEAASASASTAESLAASSKAASEAASASASTAESLAASSKAASEVASASASTAESLAASSKAASEAASASASTAESLAASSKAASEAASASASIAESLAASSKAASEAASASASTAESLAASSKAASEAASASASTAESLAASSKAASEAASASASTAASLAASSKAASEAASASASIAFSLATSSASASISASIAASSKAASEAASASASTAESLVASSKAASEAASASESTAESLAASSKAASEAASASTAESLAASSKASSEAASVSASTAESLAASSKAASEAASASSSTAESLAASSKAASEAASASASTAESLAASSKAASEAASASASTAESGISFSIRCRKLSCVIKSVE
ncbi:glycoside hydrolase family 70 protein [Lactobacillaceae bacterium Scapto_B20]